MFGECQSSSMASENRHAVHRVAVIECGQAMSPMSTQSQRPRSARKIDCHFRSDVCAIISQDTLGSAKSTMREDTYVSSNISLLPRDSVLLRGSPNPSTEMGLFCISALSPAGTRCSQAFDLVRPLSRTSRWSRSTTGCLDSLPVWPFVRPSVHRTGSPARPGQPSQHRPSSPPASQPVSQPVSQSVSHSYTHSSTVAAATDISTTSLAPLPGPARHRHVRSEGSTARAPPLLPTPPSPARRRRVLGDRARAPPLLSRSPRAE